jgi:hypothetical protein
MVLQTIFLTSTYPACWKADTRQSLRLEAPLRSLEYTLLILFTNRYNSVTLIEELMKRKCTITQLARSEGSMRVRLIRPHPELRVDIK